MLSLAINVQLKVYHLIIAILLAIALIFSFNPEVTNTYALHSWAGLKIWQPFTYFWFHGNWTHVVMNAILLLPLGSFVEKKMGSGRFLAAYIIIGVLTFIMTFLIPDGSKLIGSSACVYGVLMIATFLKPKAKVWLMFIVPMRLSYLTLILFCYEAFMMFYSGLSVTEGVSHTAHVIGMSLGASLIILPSLFPRLGIFRFLHLPESEDEFFVE